MAERRPSLMEPRIESLMGKVDSKGFANTLHGLTIKAADEPGILMDVTFDQNGDIDRQSFLVEVVEGKQVVKQVLPKLK